MSWFTRKSYKPKPATEWRIAPDLTEAKARLDEAERDGLIDGIRDAMHWANKSDIDRPGVSHLLLGKHDKARALTERAIDDLAMHRQHVQSCIDQLCEERDNIDLALRAMGAADKVWSDQDAQPVTAPDFDAQIEAAADEIAAEAQRMEDDAGKLPLGEGVEPWQDEPSAPFEPMTDASIRAEVKRRKKTL